ncbi:MAG: RDD family protein [Anaerolineaceae bacterium]|jgi:uncharacterized RDD family membrane protein YckC
MIDQNNQQTMSAYNPVYAGFWNRFAAIFIDGLILGAFGWVLIRIFGVRDDTFFYSLITTIAGFLYYTLQESSSYQATLGKRLLGIKVTDLSGARISFGKAAVRYLAKILSALILFFGFIMAAFTEKKQALHDMIAGTLVIKS